ncbi:fluoride efflux transporter FluC [Methylohalobius crimeensis]|uniref:fluoride efflux transporter FluC n=1 Tax=Methylohalobius crimeensis TaxID=244365 RepID=UPI0003B64E4B|nr:CrcB family protein [Methylohalobius crimeensis]
MIQIFAIAFGGAVGALLRFFISSGVSAWLGPGFPYGTLVVNVLGSYLIGLMSEALLLERVAVATEFRAGVLVGLFGSLTTFSTFSVETLALLQQGAWPAALGNIGLSAGLCTGVAFLGLLSGRSLFYPSRGIIYWSRWPVPYGWLLINFLIAVLIGFFLTFLVEWSPVSDRLRAVLTVLLVGGFVTFSSLYLALFLHEEALELKHHGRWMVGLLLGNAMVCLAGIWLGFWGGELW